jgi:hypothetical protein
MKNAKILVYSCTSESWRLSAVKVACAFVNIAHCLHALVTLVRIFEHMLAPRGFVYG